MFWAALWSLCPNINSPFSVFCDFTVNTRVKSQMTKTNKNSFWLGFNQLFFIYIIKKVGNLYGLLLVLSQFIWKQTGWLIISRCPPGYTGLSCQLCSSGFERVPGGTYLGTCAGCNCNGHASACDPISGHCLVISNSVSCKFTLHTSIVYLRLPQQHQRVTVFAFRFWRETLPWSKNLNYFCLISMFYRFLCFINLKQWIPAGCAEHNGTKRGKSSCRAGRGKAGQSRATLSCILQL